MAGVNEYEQGPFMPCENCGAFEEMPPNAGPGERWCYDCIMEHAAEQDQKASEEWLKNLPTYEG